MTVGLAALRTFRPEQTTAAIAGAIDNLIGEFLKAMGDMHIKVDAAQDHWKGDAAKSASERALGERLAGNRLAAEFGDVAAAYRTHGQVMDGFCSAAVKAADEYIREGFTVSDDGTVTVPEGMTGIKGFLGEPIPMTTEALQQHAVEATTRVKGLITNFNDADTALAAAVTTHLGDMVAKANGEAGAARWVTDPVTSDKLGHDDGAVVASGTATDADLRRIAARLSAAGITPEDVAAINAGQKVELSEAQWNYLHSFYNTAGLDGLTSMTDRLTSAGDTTAASAVVNQLNTLANPNVHSAGPHPLLGPQFHPRGGLDQLPAEMRDALARQPSFFDGRTGHGWQTGSLTQVMKLMGSADTGSAPGSEINKGLLVQGARISSQFENSWVYSTESTQYVEELVKVGGTDKIAVHDVLHGDGLPDDLSPDKVLDTFTHRNWTDDGAAFRGMMSWIEADATSPDVATSTRAGEAASGIANYVGVHGPELLHLNGDRSPSLGEVNPLVVEGIGSALSPYIPNLVGVSDQYLQTEGFVAPDKTDSTSFPKAQNIFAVIDTNKDAAIDFNAKALLTSQQLQGAWVQSVLQDPANPATDLATQSGTILGLVDKGLDDSLAVQKDTKIGEALHGFGDKGAAYDSMKALVSSGVKYVPVVGTALGPIIDFSNAQVKLDLVGYAYSMPDSSSSPVDMSNEFPSARQMYQVAYVLQSNDGLLAHDPRYDNLFDTTGSLKGYDHAVQEMGNAVKLDGALTNILNSYRGGILHDSLQDLSIKVMEGRAAVR